MSQPPDSSSSSSTKRTGRRLVPTERSGTAVNFEFLNFSHPSDAKASRARRTVRSHVTRQQHQKEHTAAAAARRTKSLPQGTEGFQQTQGTPGVLLHAASFPQPASSYTFEPPSLPTSGSEASSIGSPTYSRTASPVSPVKSPLLATLDPFELYPSHWHASIPTVIDHYLSHLALAILDYDGAEDINQVRSKWFSFVLTDQALLHSILLLSAAHCSHTRGASTHDIDIIALRGMAIGAINASTHDPSKSVGDALVGAVAHIASFEALFGDSQAYATHMSGLQQMVGIRGGLGALGLDGVLERILLFIDSNGAHLTGYPLFFDTQKFPSNFAHPRPDPNQFGIRRDSATNTYTTQWG